MPLDMDLDRDTQTVDLTIEQMTYGSTALARHEGQVVFVPYALPGERVRVRLRPTTKNWAEADLVEVLEPSPDRVEPRCPHFGPGKCGGCQWQHASYEAQLRYKTGIVREQFQRIGKLAEPPVRPCIGMADPWRYRNHVQLRNTPRGLAFVREDNRGLYPIDVCFIMNHPVYEMFEALDWQGFPNLDRLVLRGSERTGDRLAVAESHNNRSLSLPLPPGVSVAYRNSKGRVQPATGEPELREELGERTWHVSADSFFQVNTEQAERLLAVARDFAAPLKPTDILLDAYAGVGLFGISLASEVGRVYLVENHPAAVSDARRHAEGLGNVAIVRAPSEVALAKWHTYGPPPDIVLLDPPRAGCKESALRALGEMRVPTIIYVACDPATQARDIRHLLDAGYTLDAVQPVDLFPQTYHIESVARLRYG